MLSKDDPLPKPLILFILLMILVNFNNVNSQTESGKQVDSEIHQYDTSPYSQPKYNVMASISAYTPRIEETDSTPFINASGDNVATGDIACPSWLELYTIVEIDDIKYICKDRMGEERRDGNYFDIFMWELDNAIEYGRRTKKVTIWD